MPGQANRVKTPKSTEALVKENRRVTLDKIAEVLNVTHVYIHHTYCIL